MPYHHYIAAFHLAEFTPDRSRDGQVHVLDLERRTQWRTTVNRAGGETGYNAIHGIPGLHAEAMEQLLERYETAAAPILRSINETLRLPVEDDLDALLRYVALLSVNNPARRAAMNDSQERALYFMALRMLGNPSTFEAAQAECRSDGVPLLGDVSYEELQSLVQGGSLAYEMPNSAHLRGAGLKVDSLFSLLRERTWSLAIAPPGFPEFICGDHPVVLNWDADEQAALEAAAPGEPIFPPGFAMPKTELIVPLGRRVCLVSVMGGESRRLVADQVVVAESNGRMIGHASRFVYSAEPQFIWRDAQNQRQDSSAL